MPRIKYWLCFHDWNIRNLFQYLYKLYKTTFRDYIASSYHMCHTMSSLTDNYLPDVDPINAKMITILWQDTNSRVQKNAKFPNCTLRTMGMIWYYHASILFINSRFSIWIPLCDLPNFRCMLSTSIFIGSILAMSYRTSELSFFLQMSPVSNLQDSRPWWCRVQQVCSKNRSLVDH